MAQVKRAAAEAAPSGLSTAGEYDGPEQLVLELRKPLKLHDDDENPVSQLVLTEPTAKQLSAFIKAQNKAGADDVEASLVFLFANTGVSIKHLEQLGARDLKKAMDFLSGFLPDTPPTGAS